MALRNHTEREALAQKYGWHILGWAVNLDNPAGITLVSNFDGNKFLRFQHRDPLKKWESVLKAAENKKPKRVKPSPQAQTFDDVVAENKKLRAELAKLKKGKRRGK